KNPYLPEPAALKFCLDDDSARLLRNEAELLRRVMGQGPHPGIVQLRDTSLSADPPALRYELVAGGDLAGLIRERRTRGGLAPAQAFAILQQLTEAVAFAHGHGIVHRDLKPANVLVPGDAGGHLRVKVADFGIGAVAARQALLATQHKAATL